MRKGLRTGLPVALVALTLSTTVSPSWADRAGAREAAAGHTLTAASLSRLLAAATRARTIPTRLDPPLDAAPAARPSIAFDGCELGRAGVWSKSPCIYGDTSSRTSIVLFGDSHAAAWFPAFNSIARRQHWRLVVMVKAGCPPAEVNIAARFRHGAPYPECTLWRTNAKAQIAAMRPALVVATSARHIEAPEARAMPGVPTGHGGPWLDGWAAIFSFLRASARHVVFISDVPSLRVSAPGCVARHASDLRRCNTKRTAAERLPDTKAQEIALAKRDHVRVIDPMAWFCTRTKCPVIVKHILMYRDSAHMTPSWSRFISPVLADAVTPILHRRAA